MADHRFYEGEVQMLRSRLRRALLAALLFFSAGILRGENLGPLASTPSWKKLQRYGGTMSRDEFVDRLQGIYATRGYDSLIDIGPDSARIMEDRAAETSLLLRFANGQDHKLPPHYWRPLSQLKGATGKRPLQGLHVALDPGHLGGRWAKMEERWFRIGESAPVEEGEMTLRVAKLLAPRLRRLGAEVTFVRRGNDAITPKRPDDFRQIARLILQKAGVMDPPEDYAPHATDKDKSVAWQSELLFYRQSEIRYRARRVNELLQPDLVLCLHFNAEEWGDPENPTLIDANHFHVLVNGSYLPDELEQDDERYEMLRRLLSRVSDEEIPLANAMAETFARETKLPPYQYTRDTVTKLGNSGYVYARNLLATRLFRCPVVYFEPYVMNNAEVFARVQAGDYEGTREIAGISRPSIFREYATAVADGLAEYCRRTRRRE